MFCMKGGVHNLVLSSYLVLIRINTILLDSLSILSVKNLSLSFGKKITDTRIIRTQRIMQLTIMMKKVYHTLDKGGKIFHSHRDSSKE